LVRSLLILTAKRSPWNGFEPLGFDFLSAHLADAVFAAVNSPQRFVNGLDSLAVPLCFLKKRVFCFGGVGAVDGIEALQIRLIADFRSGARSSGRQLLAA
jgi:hypothetical protein